MPPALSLGTIAVVGAGAIGGWIASRLALAGRDVMALGRQGPAKVLSVSEAGETRTAQFTRFEKPADLVILAVKAPALADAAQAARPLIGPDTLILPMLNGVPWWFSKEGLRSVDPDRRIAEALPLDQVVGCVVHASCSRGAIDHIIVNHVDRLILGEPSGGESARVAQLCALFEEAGIACQPSTNVKQAIWYKLWGNATLNPLSALTRSTADRLISDPQLRSWMIDAMAELAMIGEAIGCPVSETGSARMAVTAKLGAFRTSMLQDVEAGRPMELEALLGAPIEIARSKGIATPRLDLLYALTRQLGESLALV